MLQLALTIIIFLIIVIPVGRYMYHIATWNHTLADPVFDRLDGVIYKIGGVNPHQGMNLSLIHISRPAYRNTNCSMASDLVMISMVTITFCKCIRSRVR